MAAPIEPCNIDANVLCSPMCAFSICAKRFNRKSSAVTKSIHYQYRRCNHEWGLSDNGRAFNPRRALPDLYIPVGFSGRARLSLCPSMSAWIGVEKDSSNPLIRRIGIRETRIKARMNNYVLPMGGGS